MQDTTWIDTNRVQMAVQAADILLDALDTVALDFVHPTRRQDPAKLLQEDDDIWQTLQEQTGCVNSNRMRALVVAVLRYAQAR